MLDVFHIPIPYGNADVQIFTGKSAVAGASWENWVKPRGKSMLSILLIGKGGNGGTGVIGANSTAAGGGGGGSGGMTSLTMPLVGLADTLYLSLAGQSATTTLASYICIAPNTTALTTLMIANGGGNGGNGAAGTGGTAGTAGAIATVATMPLGWQWANLALAGQAGAAGGGAVVGVSVTIPATGLIVTGGAGGAGVGSAASTGFNGGGINVAGVRPFTAIPADGGTATATVPPRNGQNGLNALNNGGIFWYGGSGGATTHGSATGAGLYQASGGHGAWGCGGGGMGGALTGSPVGAVVGQGGPAIAIITCW